MFVRQCFCVRTCMREQQVELSESLVCPRPGSCGCDSEVWSRQISEWKHLRCCTADSPAGSWCTTNVLFCLTEVGSYLYIKGRSLSDRLLLRRLVDCLSRRRTSTRQNRKRTVVRTTTPDMTVICLTRGAAVLLSLTLRLTLIVLE